MQRELNKFHDKLQNTSTVCKLERQIARESKSSGLHYHKK